MIKKERIIKALGISPLVYQNSIDIHFGLWCNKYCVEHALPNRQLITDQALYDWYQSQWAQKVELPFYVDNREFLEAGIVDQGRFQTLFLNYAEDVQQVYPAPILKRIYRNHKQKQQQQI